MRLKDTSARLPCRSAQRLLRAGRFRAPEEGRQGAPAAGADRVGRVAHRSARRGVDELVPDRRAIASMSRSHWRCPGRPSTCPPPPPLDRKNASIDLLGVVTDEQGRAVGRIRDTMQIPAAQVADAREQTAAISVGRDAAGRAISRSRWPSARTRKGRWARSSFRSRSPTSRTSPSRSARSCSARNCASPAAAVRVARRARAAAADRGGGRGGPGGPGGFGGPPGGFVSQRGGGVRLEHAESAAARRAGDRPEPVARRHAGPADVLLLRGLRSRRSRAPARRRRRASRRIWRSIAGA